MERLQKALLVAYLATLATLLVAAGQTIWGSGTITLASGDILDIGAGAVIRLNENSTMRLVRSDCTPQADCRARIEMANADGTNRVNVLRASNTSDNLIGGEASDTADSPVSFQMWSPILTDPNDPATGFMVVPRIRATGAAPPATCNIGDLFLDTDAATDTNCVTTAGNTWCYCGATDVWTAVE